MKTLRIYVDASVVGGCLDVEFAPESRALLQMAQDGQVVLIVSDLLLLELEAAPEPVKALLDSLPDDAVEFLSTGAEADRLRGAYLAAGVVGPAREGDALHVANATVAAADLIVSWNFKHIVHFDKIRGYNAVNLREGYGLIAIHTPTEVI